MWISWYLVAELDRKHGDHELLRGSSILACTDKLKVAGKTQESFES